MLPEALRSRRSRCQSAETVGRGTVGDVEFRACPGHRGDTPDTGTGAVAAAVEGAALDDDLAVRQRDGEAVIPDGGQAGDGRPVGAASLPRAVRSEHEDFVSAPTRRERRREPRGNRRPSSAVREVASSSRRLGLSAPSSGGTVTAASPRPNRLSKARASPPIMAAPSRIAGPSSRGRRLRASAGRRGC